MKRAALLFFTALLPAAGMASDRSIAVPPKVATSWGFLTNSTAVKQSRTLGVGFWQRASGAKPGVGEVFASAMEFQLPEAAPSRLRSATFRFSLSFRQSPYEPLDLGLSSVREVYTEVVIHDTLGRRISPSLFRAR